MPRVLRIPEGALPVAVATAKPKATDRAAWTYASGLVSALDGRLLPHRATLDLLAADSLDDLLVRARQTLLLADLAESTQPFALAEGIDACYAAAVRQIGAACPLTTLADTFLLPVEWQAFRAYLRAEALGQERVATPGSALPDAVWAQCWNSPYLVEPPYDLFAAAAQNLRAKMPREKRDERLVDEITLVYETRDITRTVRSLRNPAVAEWVTTWLKLRLGLALLRCSLNQWGHIRYADALDDFGVSKQDIMGLATPERTDWRTPFVHLGLPAVTTIADDEPRPAIVVERLIDDRITDLVQAARGVPFGPEPVAAFLWALHTEALNLKLIITGTAAGLDRQTIAADVRQTYG